MPEDQVANQALSEQSSERYVLYGRVGAGESFVWAGPERAETLNECLKRLMAARQPGEFFWLERASPKTGEDGLCSPYEVLRYRGEISPREAAPFIDELKAMRVCVGGRPTLPTKVERQRVRYPRSLIDGFLCTTCRDLVRWTSPVLIITLFGILVILLAGNFLGQ